MFHYHKLIICCVLLGIAPLVRADVEIKPETSSTHGGPYRPWSLEVQQVNPEHLHSITAETLAKMSLEDPFHVQRWGAR